MHSWRRWRLEAFLVVLASVEIASIAAGSVPHKPAALIVTSVSVLVLFGWRRQPLAATVAAFGALTVSVAIVPRSTTAQFFGTLATFAIAGAVNREREAIVAWAAGAGLLGYAAWVDPLGGGTSDFLLSLAFGTTMWAAGMLVARRGRHLRAVVAEAERAERDRETQTRQALAKERATIAREMHDVVSHGLSVVILQTLAARGVLADIDDHAVAEVDRHLDAVESSARDALSEMRRMLGLLQNAEDPASAEEVAAPVPGLGSLDDLIERVGVGRGPATVQLSRDIDLPPGLDLAVYRMAQEALTNAAKHAPDAAVDVTLHRENGQVALMVRNGPSPTPPLDPPVGAGRGLIGIQERAALYGGTVDVGPTPDGGFIVSVTIPEPLPSTSGTAAARS